MHGDIFCIEFFPHIDDVADVGKGDDVVFGHGLAHLGAECIEVVGDHVNPTLLVTFVCCFGIDFSGNRDNACDISCFRLCAAHTTESCCDKENGIIGRHSALLTHAACGVHYGDGRSVHDALRTDVHV